MPTKRRGRAQPRTATDRALAAGATEKPEVLLFSTQQRNDRPTDTASIFARSRTLAKDSSFLNYYLPLKRSIYNYGFQVLPAEKGKAEALKKWLAELVTNPSEPIVDPQTKEEVEVELNMTNWDRIKKFIDDAWTEYHLLDSVVALWLEDLDYATVAPLERCEFTDALGIPFLRYTHGLTPADIEKLPEDKRERFEKNGTIPINPAEGEHFRALKKARVGEGFGTPSLFSIFRVLGEVESKEVGFYNQAFLMRRATRHHKLGHAIQSGERAGKPLHFWTAKRSKATKDAFENTQGPVDFTSNFDHEIVFPWPDLKIFDATAWQGSDHRLNQWGGPIAQMMIAKGETPYLPQLLEALVVEERVNFGEFAASVINAAFKPPTPIRCQWSNRIFKESRLQAEMVKFGVQQGFISTTTASKIIGVDKVEESELKIMEVDDPDATKKERPAWDQSHAIAPASGETAITAKEAGAKGQDPQSRNGKPPGTQDKS